MKRVIFTPILALFLLLFYSCEDISTNPEKTQISFSINQLSSALAKSETIFELDDVDKALVTLKQGGTIILDNEEIELVNWGQEGVYRTQIIEVEAGIEYTLDQFELRDSNNVTLFAAPLDASPLAFMVDDPLPISVIVTNNEQKAIPVEVLSTANYTPADFGYPYFVVVDKTRLPFSVAVMAEGNLTTAELTVNYGDSTYTQTLIAGNNNILIGKDAESYTVTVSKDGYFSYEETFTKEELWDNHLFIELEIDTTPPPVYETYVFVAGGSFTMGDDINDSEGDGDENPPIAVTLSSYYISATEVTNQQFCDFLNDPSTPSASIPGWINLSYATCRVDYVGNQYQPEAGYENYPVHCVNWFGAQAYCNWTGGRLPTEAEWEFAARGGNNSNGYRWSGSYSPDVVAWYNSNSSSYCHEVAQKQANELGIYDMSGNVREWCSDWYSGSYDITGCGGLNPQGVPDGLGATSKVIRGGSYMGSILNVRSRDRYNFDPGLTFYDAGIRVVKTSL